MEGNGVKEREKEKSIAPYVSARAVYFSHVGGKIEGREKKMERKRWLEGERTWSSN